MNNQQPLPAPKSLLDFKDLRREMTVDETQMMIQIGQIPPDLVFGSADARELGPIGLILFQRLHASTGLKINTQLAMMIIQLCRSAGEAVMWAYTLHCMRYEFPNPDRVITLLEWVDLFPCGVPTEEAYEKVWVDQKTRNGNRLDYDASAWGPPTKTVTT